MRAFLVLLMLTFLPLQFSAAAAVEAYCGHVQSTQTTQVTHHQPGHGQAVEGLAEGIAGERGFDLDCGTCHANCAAAVSVTAAPVADPAGMERVEHLVERFLPPWHERPYRPQWSAPRVSGLSA
jgi:hypothetical protein